jgi:putative transcriptional regulator
MTYPNLDKGSILVAEPFLGDPNFERSVVLVCEHTQRGSFGLVLNQPTQLTLQDVMQESPFLDLPLYLGGPVQQNTLHFIHRLPNLVPDSIPVARDLYWGGDYEEVKTLLNIGKIQETDIRFFLGYSGWSSGQLESELSEDAWIVSKADASFIFDTPSEQFWRGVLKKMGGKHKLLANYPIDPRLN